MIERSEQDQIVTLRLAHGKASALDLELCEAIASALAEARDARAVILTGTGSIFSAGVDLFRMTNEGAPYVARFVPALDSMIRTLFAFPRPVVAAINGHAIAGGCIIAAACDVRVMSAGTGRIGVPELLVGVPFPSLIVEVLRFAIAPPHLQELMLRAGTFKPDDALKRGIVDEVADDVHARALANAQHLGAIDAEAFRLTKLQLRGDVFRRAEVVAREHDAAVLAHWSSPATHQNIRDYLARTVHKKTS
jgi:enoyl-CoA hydratase